MGEVEKELKNITVGIVFTPFNWQLSVEWDRIWRKGSLSIGPLFLTLGLP